MAFNFNKIPVLGSLFGDDEERFNRAMDRMKAAYEQYRPQIEAARMRGLNQSLGAFDQSVNPMLVAAYGPSAAINTGLLGQNPMHPTPPNGGALPPMDQPSGLLGGAPPGSFGGDNYPGGPPPIPQDVANRRIVDDARQAQANRNKKSNPFHNPGY